MCRLLAAVFAGATAVLVGISLGFPGTGHYAVSFTYEGAQYDVAIGLLQTCTSSPQWTMCEWLNTNEVRLPSSCTRAGATYAARFITAAALIGLGGLLSLVAVFTPICCLPRSSAIAMTTLLTFAFACIATAGGLFYFSVFWLYCDVPDVCDHYTALGATACSEHITLYAWLGVAAAGTALLGLCFGIAGIAMTPRPAAETEQDVIADDNEEGDAESCAACAAFRIEIADVKQRLVLLESIVATPCPHPNAVVVGMAAGNSPSSSDCTRVVSGAWQRRNNPIEQAASDWAAADEAEALTDERPAREVIRVAVPH